MHQTKDLRDPMMESIINLSSWKKGKTRMTRTTLTIRSTRRTRTTEMLTSRLPCPTDSTMVSTTPRKTTITSKTFHAKSSVLKKSTRPSAVHRSPSSTTKSRVSMHWTAKKIGGVSKASPPSCTSSAITCTCQPVAKEFTKIKQTLLHSKALLEIMRFSRDCVVMTSAFFCTMRYWSTDFFTAFFFFCCCCCQSLCTGLRVGSSPSMWPSP
mmetsp:Transcript_39052/g.90542  ORF Transcript_39052/g.90542 Transcript_39052/m.90542 type:complete len:211 (+) Transcript_39052:787-1419(+)